MTVEFTYCGYRIPVEQSGAAEVVEGSEQLLARSPIGELGTRRPQTDRPRRFFSICVYIS